VFDQKSLEFRYKIPQVPRKEYTARSFFSSQNTKEAYDAPEIIEEHREEEEHEEINKDIGDVIKDALPGTQMAI
jgi:hypothetical protein